MPNNIVFNHVAEELHTQIFGQNGNDIVPIQTDPAGNLLVAGTLTALMSTVTAIVDSGTITALLSTVTAVTLPIFTEESTTIAEIVNETASALTVETSLQRMYSFYVANTSAATLTAFLQISPTTADTYFLNDASGAVGIAGSAQAVLVAQKYMRYTRLMLQAGADTASAVAFYNGQT